MRWKEKNFGRRLCTADEWRIICDIARPVRRWKERKMADSKRQHVMTDGLILREYQTIAESDRFVAILTRDQGLVRAAARGARKITSRSGAATQPLCYARLSLIPGRDKDIIEDARPLEVFFSLRQDAERMALGQYFCELALHLTPTGAPAPEHLRLLLNALHYLSTGSRDPRLVKAVVEGRLMCLEGYAPDLTGCCVCGAADKDRYWFSPAAGNLTCDHCGDHTAALPVTAGVLAALRHILYGDFDRCFAFTLPPEEMRTLAHITEQFLLAQQQRSYRTLEFYHTLQTDGT